MSHVIYLDTKYQLHFIYIPHAKYITMLLQNTYYVNCYTSKYWFLYCSL